MRENKGITLTSLIIYIIVLTTVIGTVAMITKYFKRNMNETIIANDLSEQYTRFTTYITNDINSSIFKNVEISNGILNINFTDNTFNQYIFSNNKIYFQRIKAGAVDKKITLCTNIMNCVFSYESNVLKTSVVINDRIYTNNYNIK